MISFDSLARLFQLVLIDLSFAADNALIIGVAVASLPPATRKRAMTIGIVAATVLRIIMAFFAVQMLHITGVLAAGGFLLLWVCWKMVREVQGLGTDKPKKHIPVAEKFADAVRQIVIADVSMSLDNVLGVAGVARDHIFELVVGLALSVALMGLVSSQIARLTVKYPKIAYIGIAIVFYAALRMIYDGVQELAGPLSALV